MSEARIDRISNENSTAGPIISGITTFSGQNYFVPPKGTTAERPSYCSPGSIRFNTDSAKLEYFDSLQWLEMEAFNNELGGGTGSNTGLGNRGVFAGGYTFTNVIQYITITTLGNSQDFGDLSGQRNNMASASSSSRGVFAGGYKVGSTNTIEFVTIASTGNSQDFGDLNSALTDTKGCSSSTRGLFGGGNTNPTIVNTIDYITIASNGVNAQDFGDLSQSRSAPGSCSSSTRGVFAGGATVTSPSPSTVNTIDYITISTTGNAADFGDLSLSRYRLAACSNSTRGLFFGGRTTPTNYNIIDYVTIASTGNAQDFGDLTAVRQLPGPVSSPTRAVIGGGDTPAGNTIDYVTILSTGNAIDFGDLITPVIEMGGSLSNGHGGL